MSSQDNAEGHVMLLLDDSTLSSSQLKSKYQAATTSKVKWINNRSKLNSVSIPIEFMNDREYVKMNIEQYPYTFEYASMEIRSDKQFIMDVIVKNNIFDALNYMTSELMSDSSFILEMIEVNENVLDYADNCDIQFILFPYENWKESQEEDDSSNNSYSENDWKESQEKEDNNSNNTYKYSPIVEIPKETQFDYQVEKDRIFKTIEWMDCYQYNGLNDLLKFDIDVCLACLKNDNGIYFVFNIPQNRENKELIERGVREISEIVFFYADEGLKQDIEFVSHLIHVNPHVLLFADKKLRRDKNLVLQSVELDYETLNYASRKLIQDEEFLEKANSIGNFKHNKTHEEVIVNFISHNNRALEKLPHSLRKRRDLMVKVMSVSQNSSSMLFVHESLVRDKGFILECINSMTESAVDFLFNYFPYEMRQDPEIATSLVSNCSKNYKFFSHLPFISSNRDLVLKVIKGDPSQYEYIAEDFRNDKEITREVLKYSCQYLALSAKQLQMDKDFVLEYILIDPEVIKYTDLRYDPEFILQAVKLDGNILKYSEYSNLSDEIEMETVKQNGYYSLKSQIISQLLQARMDYEYPDLVK